MQISCSDAEPVSVTNTMPSLLFFSVYRSKALRTLMMDVSAGMNM